MSRRIPSRRENALGDAVEERLRPLLAQSRATLFEPWRALVADSEALRREMDRTVESLQVFFSKWTVEIVILLAERRAVRFNELRGRLEGISGRTLAQRLRDLEAQGLVARRVFDEMPVRVEYALTERGLDAAYLALPLVLYLRTSQPPPS